MKTTWSIKNKLLLFSLCISLVPIIVITVVYYHSARKELKQQIIEKMIAVAESKTLHIEAFLNAIEGRCIDFSSDGYIRDKLHKINHKDTLNQDLIINLSKHIKDRKMPLDPDIIAITILDKTGAVAASTVPSIIGEDFSSHEEYIHFAGKNKTGVFTHSPHFQEYLGHDSIEVAAPVISMVSGQMIGVIINAYQQNMIDNITSNRKGMGDSGEIVIGVKDADLIHFMNSLRYAPDNNRIIKVPLSEETAKPMRLALEGHDGTVIGRDYRGVSVIAAYQSIPSMDWGLVVKMDKAEAFTPLKLLRNIAIVLGGLCSIAVILVGLTFSISTSRPINRLTAAAERISSGNYGHKVEIDQNDEIGALALGFNNMTSKLTQEISEHKKAEVRLTGLNKELEAFCYSVSHDLRTPLRGINGFSRILQDEYADKLDLEGRDYLKRICAASHRMEHLITDLLGLSRITRSNMQNKKVDLSALVKNKASELHETNPERQVEFVIAEGYSVQGDTNLLEIVIDNLMNNAWKFTGKQPQARIEFGISSQDGENVYFIGDDGVGFDMAYVNKLFGAFQRLHTLSEFEGTGIGLATVHRIIQRHGGHIWADGEIGQGAKFSFTL